MEEISSTTPSVDELTFHQDVPEYETEEANDLLDDAGDFIPTSKVEDYKPFDDDDILDLAGGAQDAIERHRSTLPRNFTEEPAVDSLSEISRPEPPQPSDPEPEPEIETPELISGFGETDTDETELKTDVSEKEETATTTPTQSKSSSPLVDLLHWRDFQRSAVVFGASLFLLLSLSTCSIVSVLAYISLALLSVTIAFRIYKGILQAVQKTEDGHPFKMYLDQDMTVPVETVHKYSDVAVGHVNTTVKELRRLFLVEDLVDSLKFGVLMWILTYVGSLFNGLTLLILALIGAFTWPVVYEKYQKEIDHYYGLVHNQIKSITGKIQAKIPGAKPKAE